MDLELIGCIYIVAVAVVIVGCMIYMGVPIFRWILDFRLNTVMTKNKFSWLFYLKGNF